MWLPVGEQTRRLHSSLPRVTPQLSSRLPPPPATRRQRLGARLNARFMAQVRAAGQRLGRVLGPPRDGRPPCCGHAAQNSDQRVTANWPPDQPLGLGPHAFRGPLLFPRRHLRFVWFLWLRFPRSSLPFCPCLWEQFQDVPAGDLTSLSWSFPAAWALLGAPPPAPHGDLVSILEFLLAATLVCSESQHRASPGCPREAEGGRGSSAPRVAASAVSVGGARSHTWRGGGREANAASAFYLNNFLRILITKGIHFHLEHVTK